MSLYFLLAAFQADAPLDPPPIKVRPVVAAPGQPAPTPAPNPTTIYRPSPVQPTAPAANPTIIYTPAAPKLAAPAAAAPTEAPAAVAAPLAGFSDASRQRIAAERALNTQRVTEHRRELAAAQEAVGRALAAEPFDMAALKSALEARDRVTAAYRDRLTKAVVDLLSDIPPAERVAVARAVIEGDLPKPAAPPAKPTPPSAGR